MKQWRYISCCLYLYLIVALALKKWDFSADPSLTPQGKGAKEKLLTRIIVSRCEVDLKKVCSEYKAHFGESLQKAIMVDNPYNLAIL